MFTGIIKDVGSVVRVDETRGDKRFTLKTNIDLSKAEIGASIACAGCCLTVVEKDEAKGLFVVDVSEESLSKTTLNKWDVGTRINIEPSLKMGDELGGHMVSGHVDGVARIRSIAKEGDSHRLQIECAPEFAPFIAPKGSVALDGISLTVNDVRDSENGGCVFGVNIIPHTWQVTSFGDLQEGQDVHLEIDTMARYVARYAARLLEAKN